MKTFALQIKNEKTKEWWDYREFRSYGEADYNKRILEKQSRGLQLRVWRKSEKRIGAIGLALKEKQMI